MNELIRTIFSGKVSSNAAILLLVLGGVIAEFISPEIAEKFKEICLGVVPLLLAQITAIWHGNKTKNMRAK